MIDRIFVKKRNKKDINPAIQINAIIDILENCKLDIVYMEKLKMPLTRYEEAYFRDQICKLNSAISFLIWFRDKRLNIRKKFLGIF